MKCINPLTIRNPSKDSYRRKVEPYLTVPCGKCFACLQNLRSEWIFRLKQEFNACKTSAYFVTLTYDDDHEPFTSEHIDGVYEPTLVKDHVKKFLHDLRDDRSNRSMKLRYFLVGEYGEDTGRPHYHIALFGYNGDNIMLDKTITDHWPNGGVHILYLSGALIGYITKYMLKQYDEQLLSNKPEDWQKPFRLMSQGLGKQWCTRQKLDYMVANDYKMVLNDGDGHRKVPHYFLDKLCQNYGFDYFGNHFNKPTAAEKENAAKYMRRKFGLSAYKHMIRHDQSEYNRMVSDGLSQECIANVEYDRYLSAERRAKKAEAQKNINKKFNQSIPL